MEKHNHTNIKRITFTTADIAPICGHSRETIKRWLEKGEIKGYHVGTSGHWRVTAEDFALFLKDHNIPFPEPKEVGVDLKALMGIKNTPPFCWEFNKDTMDNHARSEARCEDCLVYKTRSIKCYALRKEVRNKKILCKHSCEECPYFHFLQKRGYLT
jgi:excisionase family DNA binding protein